MAAKNPHNIVLIEDNPADTLLLRHALGEQTDPFNLHVLTDGESALTFIRNHCHADDPEPCLIVLDLHLPRYDGITVLHAIRSEPGMAQVAVAVLTTSVSPAERLQVLELGVELYRTKPIGWDETVDLARELIEICRSPRSIARASA